MIELLKLNTAIQQLRGVLLPLYSPDNEYPSGKEVWGGNRGEASAVI